MTPAAVGLATADRKPRPTAARASRLTVALAVNAALVVGQVLAGLVAHSSGLLADAGHNLTDVAGLGLSLLAIRWAARPRSDTRTFGNHRATILAALVNSAALAVVTVAIVVFGVVRLVHPHRVDGGLVAVVAGVSLVANLGNVLVLQENGHDLNMRANVLHAVADALAALVVLVAGIVVAVTGGGAWNRIDPAASLVVAFLIIFEATRLTRASVSVLLESTPAGLDLDALRTAIVEVDGVDDVHDLHVWSLSSDVRALSAHLVLTGHPTLEEAQAVGGLVRQRVSAPYELAHTTFELECERCVDDDLWDPCEMDDLPANVRRGGLGHGHGNGHALGRVGEGNPGDLDSPVE